MLSKPLYRPVETFAVIELFTSQGCMRCPAADLLLSKVVNEAEGVGNSVIGLSFHTTYYNHLGWKDPYSSKTNDERQEQYANQFVYDNLYTPQMVVNGTYEFTGASEVAIKHALNKAFNRPTTAQVAAKVKKHRHHITIDYEIYGVKQDCHVNFALVDSEAENHVPQGENKNRRLIHSNVVGAFKSLKAKKKGRVTMSLPDDFEIDNSFLAIYIQDIHNMEILGASRFSIDTP